MQMYTKLRLSINKYEKFLKAESFHGFGQVFLFRPWFHIVSKTSDDSLGPYLVYGDFPNSDVILYTLEKIRERMNTIKWTIKT